MGRPLQPCGTVAAYQRHLKRREVPCQACVLANREKRHTGPARLEELDQALAVRRAS